MVEAKELQRGVLANYSTTDAVEKYTQRVAEGLRKYEKAAIDRFFPGLGKVLIVGCGDVILKEGGKGPVFWHYFDESEVQDLLVEDGFHDSRILRVSELGESWDNVFIGFGRKP